MKVLWIKSDFPLPADTGGKIRTLNLLNHLAKRSEVTFLSYAPPDMDPALSRQLSDRNIRVVSVPFIEEKKEGLSFQFRVLSGIASSRPYFVNKYISTPMKVRLRELLAAGSFDVLLCDFLEMAWCAEWAGGVPTVLFEHNVETLIWRRYHQTEKKLLSRLYFNYEQRRVEQFERRACAGMDLVLTVSDNDSVILRREFGVPDCVTIPTGVDVDYFHPQGKEIANRLVFCGSMDWMPNIDAFWWFYRSIYPLIKAHVPTVSFAVIGRRPPRDILDVAREDSSVLVSGTVDDVRPHVSEGQIYIVPIRVGGGTRIKIYEAMAMKMCVLSTTIGAEGLPLADGRELVLADDPGNFARRITELLQDENLRRQVAETGYQYVRKFCSWDRSAQILEQALKRGMTLKGSQQLEIPVTL